MAPKWKIFFFTVFFTAFTVHFVFICSYLSKPNMYSAMYVYPFFHQSWNLFVPPPDNNYHLYIYEPRKAEAVSDVFNEILTRHQKNRLKGYESILIALSNSIHYFEKDAEIRNLKEGKINANKNFLIIENIVKGYLQNTKKIKADKVKIILIAEPVRGGKRRIYYN